MILEKYFNYGECEICHKKTGRLLGANICMECFDNYLKHLGDEE